MITGVDLGNFEVKTSQRVSFLAKISEDDIFNEENLVTFNGKRLFVAEGEFSTDWNKSLKENTLPLLFTALARSSQENIFQVVLGLPVEQYKKNKDTLKALIENNRMSTIKIGDELRNIIITDVDVAPECAAAYYNLSTQNKQLIGNKPLIIVDIGGRTTDVCLFINGKIAKVKTIPTGMLNVHADIVKRVNSDYTESFTLEEGQNILSDGLFLEGKNQDISFIKPILVKHFNSIWKALQLEFDVNKGYVLLTGGGSLNFRQAFKNRLPGNLILSDDPIFDNALGFGKVGENIWQRR